MLRYLFFILIAITALITLYQAISSNWLRFFPWLFVTIALILILFPVIKKDFDDRIVPVIQIFAILLFFPIFMICIFYFDFIRLNLGSNISIFYAIISGFGFLALIMIMKGQ